MATAAHILIVDDEPNVRLVFRTALEAAGYAAAEAGDGEAALAALREAPFDLVLLDLRMPLVGGMETLRRLRDEGDTTPAVMITAHGSVPDAVEAMRLGAIDFLQKPLRPGELREVVAEVLRRHAQPDRGEPQSRALGPDDHRFEEVLARAKRAMNRMRHVEAESFLRRALDLEPGSAEAHTLLGILLLGRGEPHAAHAEFDAALAADPDYQPARHNLRHLEARYSGPGPERPAPRPARAAETHDDGGVP
jgi:DNA-binding response OmpR family regulator